MKKLVLFDFDGTITNRDSFPLYFHYTFGAFRYYFGFSLFIPIYVLYKLNLITPEYFKKEILFFYLKGRSRFWLENSGRIFIKYLYEHHIIKSEFIKMIDSYKSEGAELAVVSASPEFWIKAFCDQNEIICIATRLKYSDDIFNGGFEGPNCNGKEKLNRVLDYYNINDYHQIIIFGDSKNGDGDLMSIATQVYWV